MAAQCAESSCAAAASTTESQTASPIWTLILFIVVVLCLFQSTTTLWQALPSRGCLQSLRSLLQRTQVTRGDPRFEEAYLARRKRNIESIAKLIQVTTSAFAVIDIVLRKGMITLDPKEAFDSLCNSNIMMLGFWLLWLKVCVENQHRLTSTTLRLARASVGVMLVVRALLYSNPIDMIHRMVTRTCVRCVAAAFFADSRMEFLIGFFLTVADLVAFDRLWHVESACLARLSFASVASFCVSSSFVACLLARLFENFLAAEVRAELAIKSDADAANGVLSSLCDGVVRLDKDLRVVNSSKKFEHLVRSTKDLSGTRLQDMMGSKEESDLFVLHAEKAAVKCLQRQEKSKAKFPARAQAHHTSFRLGETADAMAVRLFHASYLDTYGDPAHVVAVCQDEPDLADPSGDLPDREEMVVPTEPNKDTPSEVASGLRRLVEGCGAEDYEVRATFDALTERLQLNECTPAWTAAFGSRQNLQAFLGKEFTQKLGAWLQQPLLKVMNGKWHADLVLRPPFGGFTFHHHTDGRLYQAQLCVIVSDPLAAYAQDEGVYLATAWVDGLRLKPE